MPRFSGLCNGGSTRRQRICSSYRRSWHRHTTQASRHRRRRAIVRDPSDLQLRWHALCLQDNIKRFGDGVLEALKVWIQTIESGNKISIEKQLHNACIQVGAQVYNLQQYAQLLLRRAVKFFSHALKRRRTHSELQRPGYHRRAMRAGDLCNPTFQKSGKKVPFLKIYQQQLRSPNLVGLSSISFHDPGGEIDTLPAFRVPIFTWCAYRSISAGRDLLQRPVKRFLRSGGGCCERGYVTAGECSHLWATSAIRAARVSAMNRCTNHGGWCVLMLFLNRI